MKTPNKQVDRVLLIALVMLLLSLLIIFVREGHAGMEFINYYDKTLHGLNYQIDILEQAKTQAEAKAAMAKIRDQIKVERDIQFKEALRVLEEAMDESKLAEIYAMRRRVAEDARAVLDKLGDTFGSVGGILYFGSEVVK